MTARLRELEMMTCALCGREKAWRDGFPTRTYAECWECAWKAHVRDAHKPPWWRRRKEATA